MGTKTGSFFATKTSAVLIGVLLLVCTGYTASGQASSPVAESSTALRKGDFDGALKITAAALQQTPQDFRLLTLQGLAYSGEKDSAHALESFQAALNVQPDFLPALEGAAQEAYQQSSAAAKPFLLKILSEHPADPTANAMLAVIDYREGNCIDAVGHFQQAQALLASQPETLVEYGACLASTDRLQDAIAVLRQAVQLNPANVLARYNLTLAQWNAHQPSEAIATLAPLLSDTSTPEDVLTLAADIYEALNDPQHAVEVLRRAILDYPNNKSAYLQFAYLSYKHNSVQVGVDMLNVGLAQLPNEAQLYVARGVLLSQKSNSTQAADDFDTAMRLDPTLSFAETAKGIAKSQAHDYGAALSDFRAAVKQHPEDGLSQYLLAEALASDAAPDTPAFTEGLTAAKHAVALDPKRLNARDLLASLYLRAGDTKLSLEQSEAALRIDPNDDEAVYHEILAMRKGENKSEVPALVQRMMKIREAKAAEAKTQPYLLVEGPASSQGDRPANKQ